MKHGERHSSGPWSELSNKSLAENMGLQAPLLTLDRYLQRFLAQEDFRPRRASLGRARTQDRLYSSLPHSASAKWLRAQEDARRAVLGTRRRERLVLVPEGLLLLSHPMLEMLRAHCSCFKCSQ